MKAILAAIDLSTRSERALHRAVALARQHRARLRILNVVDDDQPQEVVAREIEMARTAIEEILGRIGHAGEVVAGIDITAGDAFRTIGEAAVEGDADLIVMGAHRRRILRDLFVGTTVERVVRARQRPVLMVMSGDTAPYARVMAAVDGSDAAGHALSTAGTLGFIGSDPVIVLHAFTPMGKGKLLYASVPEAQIEEHSSREAVDAMASVSEMLKKWAPKDMRHQLLLEEGDAATAIREAAVRLGIQLLVIGTHGRTGVTRSLLGSVADQVLREAECDVLVVPPARG